MHYFPLAWPFLLVLFVFFVVVRALVELCILKYAYERLGINPRLCFRDSAAFETWTLLVREQRDR